MDIKPMLSESRKAKGSQGVSILNMKIFQPRINLVPIFIATLVDNKIPGVASVAQRSGRPLKSIKERLNGKTGRVRGNLMGKRVDQSSRSVITPDPCISINELGVPIKIAMNLTYPEKINDLNRDKLIKYLIKNNIEAKIHYPIPLNKQKASRYLKLNQKEYKVGPPY